VAESPDALADDLALARRAEVDYLYGEVVALARALGRAAPVNARIVELVRSGEAGAAPWAAADLYDDLSAARTRA
jgi:2-dehydropantoate 2-reductase